MKKRLVLPVICQRTVVPALFGSRRNVVTLSALNGLRNFRSSTTFEPGTDSVITIDPAPALRLPSQA